MTLFQRYPFHPEGDGTHYPIQQASVKWKNGNLHPKISSNLWKRQKRKPNVFASAITSRYNISEVIPSHFSQYGKGKRKMAPGVKIGMIQPGDICYDSKRGGGGLSMKLFV